MLCFITFSKSKLPLCEAIGNLEERYPLSGWQWNQYHVWTVAQMGTDEIWGMGDMVGVEGRPPTAGFLDGIKLGLI